MPIRCIVVAVTTILIVTNMYARIDTVYRDNGVYTNVNTLSNGWEESVILQPGAPCRIVGISIYYVGTGSDTIRITGDASEGTIPPTVYAYAFNTLAKRVVNVTQTGWTYIDFSQNPTLIGGFDRVVIQHLVRPGAPQFGQDAALSASTSFYYDPKTPNPDFFNLEGIYYVSRGDYMVRLHVEFIYPDPVKGSVPMPAPMLQDVTQSVGLLNADGSPIRADMASVVDVNSDGYEDVVIGGQIFLNNNGLRFLRTQSTISAGATSWADIDNDGDPDCFAMHGFGNDKIYRQNQDGSFTDLGNSGIVNNAPAVAPLWLDYNGDGALDLFIANGRTETNGNEVFFPDRLFKNKKDGTFEDVTTACGIAAAEPSPFFDTWGASICDYNSDGRPDIFVATYRLAPDRLYRNNGDGTFTDVSVTTGVQGTPTSVPVYFGHGMGSDWGDMDNDGDVDLAVGNLGHPDSRAQYSNPSLLFKNGGAPGYVFAPLMRSDGGVSFKEMNAGMCFIDFDHDADLDLWHGQISYSAFGSDSTRYSHMYRNDGSMTDVTWDLGMQIHGAWTGVRIDYDRDGDMDLLCASGTENVKLFRNDASRGNAISVVLINTTNANATREGFGAHVVLTAAGKRYHRWLPGTVSGGRASQMTNALHFGIGDAASADSVVVYWNDGQITRTGVIVRNSLAVIDRSGVIQPGPLRLTPRQQSPSNHAVSVASPAKLSWYSAVSGVGPSTTYLLEASYDTSFQTLISGVPTVVNDTTVTLTSIDNGRTVFWRVRTNEPNAKYSSIWNFTVGSPVPTTPTLLTPLADAQGVRTKQAVFSWTRSTFMTQVKPQVVYDLQFASDTTFNPIVKTVTDISDSSYVGVTFQPLTSYAWRVRGRTAAATGAWSSARMLTTYGKTASVPLVSPADSAVGLTTRPRLVWQNVAFEDDGFVLEYDTAATFASATPRLRDDTSTITPSALKPGRRYYWRVAAKNDEGQGEWSPVWSFTVDALSDVPFAADERVGALDVRVNDVAKSCAITLDLLQSSHVCIDMFDLESRSVIDPISTTLQPGLYTFDRSIDALASGVYIVVVDIEGKRVTHTLSLTH